MRFFAVLLMMITTASAALAEKRVALLIGNSKYQNASVLANPVNDVEAMAAKLRSIGFDVSDHTNLGGQQMRVALGQFTEKALRADVALVFYAGHGIELSGQNYLIPVDAQMRSEATAQFEALALNDVIQSVQQAGTLGIVMMDACRDNPFGASMVRNNGTRSLTRGLAPVSVEGKDGLIVSFAAQEGNTADDGDGRHSPYTAAVLDVIDEPGLEIGRVFRKVRAKVRARTDGRQIPVERMQLPDREIYFVPAAVTPPPVPGPKDPPPRTSTLDALALFLQGVQGNDVDKLTQFVTLFPDHPNAPAARDLLLSLQDDAYWAQVRREDTIRAYERYLIAFRNGNHKTEAETRIAMLKVPPPPVEVTPEPVPVPVPVPTPPITAQTGPSFDCGRASTAVERAICSNAGLSRQDLRLLEAFNASSMPSKKTSQRGWIQAREVVCTGRGWPIGQCISELAQDRINALNKGTTKPLVSPGFKCSRATTKVEKAICGSDVLARQDQQLLKVFKAARAKGWVTNPAQVSWIQSRERNCGNNSNRARCIASMGAQRIAILAGQ